MLSSEERKRLSAEGALKADVCEELKNLKESGQQNSGWATLMASGSLPPDGPLHSSQ